MTVLIHSFIQILEYREIFSLFDKAGDEKIFYHEVGECLRAFGESPTNADVQKVLNNPSQDGIYINVYCKSCSAIIKIFCRLLYILNKFKRFQRNAMFSIFLQYYVI